MTNLLSQKAVLASLSISAWSARKLDRKITQETNERHNAVADAGRYNKLLIAKGGLDKLTQIAGAARQEHYRLTLPWFDDGARILPTAGYAEYAAMIRKQREAYKAAAVSFAKEYPALVEDAKRRLNGMFDQADYPDAGTIEMRFGFDTKILPCPDAKDFRVDLAKEHVEDIARDVETRMKEALQTAMQEPVRRVIENVGHMAERLRGYKPGKRDGIFRDSLVENVRDLVSLLPSFNLTGDKMLTQITERIKNELTGYDAQTLRDDQRARKKVARAADSILEQAKQLMA